MYQYLRSQFGIENLQHQTLCQHKMTIPIVFQKETSPFKDNGYSYNESYFHHANCEAQAVFNTLFSKPDEIEVIVSVYHPPDIHPKVDFIRKYFKGTNKYQIKHRQFMQSLEEGEELVSEYAIQTGRHQLCYPELIQAICNQDFPPRLPRLKNRNVSSVRFYLINRTKHVLYYIYDDRGALVAIQDQVQLEKFKKEFNSILEQAEKCIEEPIINNKSLK
ncbi:DUF3885 domain-containing protein [Oceanobacillus sojae]|uniref:DUF3885 domain-containing protein n=1 Tax=Oceanobacillus sojae TaxID=582851 RepID=A0A511ZFA1_9BACI|nr:hypothetical protein [Oceanobacillus sojae]GEN86122.1 hypothetical protein OSO01_08610 [Oceanobacillus sojae]